IDSFIHKLDDGLLVAKINASGNVVHYHCDDIGNVLALTDSTGAALERYDYDDFGAPIFLSSDGVPLVGVTTSPRGNPFLFHGMFWDNEMQLYFGHSQGGTTGPPARYGDPYSEDAMRMYEPKTGRYTSRKSGSVIYWGENAYSFASENPWSSR